MSELANRKCVPCSSGTVPLKNKALESWKAQLGEGWKIVDEHHLEKEYSFKNFRQALEFTNKVGRVADEEGHHPTITLSWGKVGVTLWTHKIDGLSESDFILAAKCDVCFSCHPS